MGSQRVGQDWATELNWNELNWRGNLVLCFKCITFSYFLELSDFSLLFYLTFYFILEYSQLTTLWQVQIDSKGTQPHIHMYPFSPKPLSYPDCHITLSRDPCALCPCWLSILNIAVCTCPSQLPNYPFSPPPPPIISLLSLWVCCVL